MTTAIFEIKIERDVVYGTADEGGRELKCNTYCSVGLENNPCCILLHGGGFAVGDKEQLEKYALNFAHSGITCVTPEYRLILKDEAKWPQPIFDVKACIRWTRANAAMLKIDPNRIAIGGNSAGGHLSLFAAGTPNIEKFEGTGGNPGVATDIRAVYSIYGITNRPLEEGAGRRMEPYLAKLGVAVGDKETDDFSPIVHISDKFPPTQLIHGEGDDTVVPEHSTTMRDALRSQGVSVELQTYAGQPHAFDLDGHVKVEYLGKAPDKYLEHIASSIKLFWSTRL